MPPLLQEKIKQDPFEPLDNEKFRDMILEVARVAASDHFYWCVSFFILACVIKIVFAVKVVRKMIGGLWTVISKTSNPTRYLIHKSS